MNAQEHGEDVQAIEALITRQFASLDWTPGAPANWDAFAADFLPDAPLYPAARPAKAQSVQAFTERMKGIAGGKLRTFHESLAGVRVHVFGNVAVAVAVCEMTENEADVKRSVEMLLLVKTEGAWRIAAQAWDPETPEKPIPAELLGGE
jgi:ketosteroid isomerase-like protein